MRIKIEVEFDVEPEDGDESEFDENAALRAADYAAYNHLALTEENHFVVKVVTVHADGFGPCIVRLPE